MAEIPCASGGVSRGGGGSQPGRAQRAPRGRCIRRADADATRRDPGSTDGGHRCHRCDGQPGLWPRTSRSADRRGGWILHDRQFKRAQADGDFWGCGRGRARRRNGQVAVDRRRQAAGLRCFSFRAFSESSERASRGRGHSRDFQSPSHRDAERDRWRTDAHRGFGSGLPLPADVHPGRLRQPRASDGRTLRRPPRGGAWPRVERPRQGHGRRRPLALFPRRVPPRQRRRSKCRTGRALCARPAAPLRCLVRQSPLPALRPRLGATIH